MARGKATTIVLDDAEKREHTAPDKPEAVWQLTHGDKGVRWASVGAASAGLLVLLDRNGLYRQPRASGFRRVDVFVDNSIQHEAPGDRSEPHRHRVMRRRL